MLNRFAVLLSATLFATTPALAGQDAPRLDVRDIAPGVHAVIGDLGGQSAENEGLNANLGFVIGEEAVLVVNSGPSLRVGEAVMQAVRERTSLPVKWVVNVNSQSHYWWGNAVFAEQDSTLIAHRAAIEFMRAQQDMQRAALEAALGPLFDGSEPVVPQQSSGERQVLDLGGRSVEILHFGPAHTPGDLALWIPDASVAFAGDIVYTERLLAVLPISDTAGWIEAFERLAALGAQVIVPGHGDPTDIDHARRDTLAYLTHMREAALEHVEAGATPSEAAQAIDQSAWAHLENFDVLSPGNASRVFLEVEADAF